MKKIDIAFTAQDSKIWDLIDLVSKYREGISQHSIVSTLNTRFLIKSVTGLEVGLLDEGEEGYTKLARLVTGNEIKIVIFLHEPLINLNDMGVRDLLQACVIQNIPFANNVATAEFILHRFFEKEMALHFRCPELVRNRVSVNA